VGLGTIIAKHFTERPSLSVNKCELRRMPGGMATGPLDFHQDGAFLGADIRTVNVWLALSSCGVDAPGLDIVPRRVERVLPTGVDGAIFKWTLSPVTVERELAGPPIVRPKFEPGDAMLFDHLLIHRTANEPNMTKQRYAIETWFFAPSTYPVPTEDERRSRPHLPLVY